MSFVRAFGLVAVFSITSSAFAEESATNAEFRHVLARADVATRVGTQPEIFSGSYRSAEGVAFYVVQDGDSLTIELPDGWGASESRLRADAAEGYFVTSSATVVKFETDV